MCYLREGGCNTDWLQATSVLNSQAACVLFQPRQLSHGLVTSNISSELTRSLCAISGRAAVTWAGSLCAISGRAAVTQVDHMLHIFLIDNRCVANTDLQH